MCRQRGYNDEVNTTTATKTDAKFTCNVWEIGRVCPRRVKLTATGDGVLLWAEVYTSTGGLLGCGPTLLGVPSNMLDSVDDRLAYAPASAPLIWRAA